LKRHHYVWAIVAVLTLGCESLPTVTRTGQVKDIVIGEKLSSAELVVSPGDEVRWINKRTAPVRIVFLDQVPNSRVSCKNNFGGWMTPNDTAKLGTNDTASVCFRDPGYVRYTVRMESAAPSGEMNVPGVVKVGGTNTQPAAEAVSPNSTTTTTTTTVTTPSP
jgi:plastocyanin